jgi:hypothetical protein
MSDANDLPAPPPKKSSAALRTLILLGLLVLIVAGGLWDLYGAKEPRDKAYDRVLALQSTATGMADPNQAPTTQADVQKAVGTQPSESTTEDGVIYERYSWRRGIPWMTYDLWVLYRDGADKEMLVAQLGEEGKPHPFYAANSHEAEAPMPDPATVRPIVDGESPYPAPRTDAPAKNETPDQTKEEADEAAPKSDDAPAETPTEEPKEDSTDPPAESPAPSTPEEDSADEDASSEAPKPDAAVEEAAAP